MKPAIRDERSRIDRCTLFGGIYKVLHKSRSLARSSHFARLSNDFKGAQELQNFVATLAEKLSNNAYNIGLPGLRNPRLRFTTYFVQPRQ